MKPILFCLTICLLFSCTSNKNNCDNKICTEEFRTVGVKFLNANGQAIIVKDFQSVYLKTNQPVSFLIPPDTTYAKGFYMVASDANLKELASNGDKILVSAKHPATNVVKQAEFVVAGGDCACHISKISGPETIVFE